METYALKRYEPNPHQDKEPLTKNRTFQRYRWREIVVFQARDDEIAKDMAAELIPNSNDDCKLVHRDTNRQISVFGNFGQ